jgi:hypothetical protein
MVKETIGEVVGIVRDGKYAIGLQALNPKTLGGILNKEGGADGPRGDAAIARSYGSSLQAYSLDRSKPRRLSVWNDQYPDMPVAPIPGETTIGSAIALFGCPEKEVLEHVGAIELAEGLPHPMINGTWLKQSPETGRAYLIADFNEGNIDEMLDYTNQAGLASLYHEGPFLSWGHFILDPKSFPNGNAGISIREALRVKDKMAPREEWPLVVKRCQSGLVGIIQHLVDVALVEVCNQVGPSGFGGLFEPSPIDHRMGKSFGQFDGADMLKYFFFGTAEERNGRPDSSLTRNGGHRHVGILVVPDRQPPWF